MVTVLGAFAVKAGGHSPWVATHNAHELLWPNLCRLDLPERSSHFLSTATISGPLKTASTAPMFQVMLTLGTAP